MCKLQDSPTSQKSGFCADLLLDLVNIAHISGDIEYIEAR